jgi:hypothetical protein
LVVSNANSHILDTKKQCHCERSEAISFYCHSRESGNPETEDYMLKIFSDFTAKLANHNYKILWSEAVVLSVIIGAGLASWPGVIILLATLTCILNRHWGTIYLVGLFSCAWGFLAGMIGFGLGGWVWALLLGILALISGVKIHLRDLKRPFNQIVAGQNNTVEWGYDWFMGRQNLN